MSHFEIRNFKWISKANPVLPFINSKKQARIMFGADEINSMRLRVYGWWQQGLNKGNSILNKKCSLNPTYLDQTSIRFMALINNTWCASSLGEKWKSNFGWSYRCAGCPTNHHHHTEHTNKQLMLAIGKSQFTPSTHNHQTQNTTLLILFSQPCLRQLIMLCQMADNKSDT